MAGKRKSKKVSPLWNLVAYAAAGIMVVGLIWVAWPLLFPPKPQPDTAHAVQQLSAEHPDAEALNPAGSDSKKK